MQRALIAAAVALATLGAAVSSREGRPPNVVLIVMDDLGYGDIGSYGAVDVATPRIDSLARDGVRFTDFYASAPVCSPTRAALITGRYQQRVGIEWALNEARDLGQGLRPSATFLPRLLKAGGYATALAGKWHLGWRPEFGPNAHGFDEFFGSLGGAIDYYEHRRDDGVPDLWENTSPIERSGYLTDLITRRAVDFIDRQQGRTFFLEVAYTAPHFPFQPPERPSSALRDHGTLVQKPDSPRPASRRDYAAMVERADRGIGEILDALDRRGLRRDTVVIFTNDNGGEWLSRNAPLFHRKQTLWEGGIRVPCLIRWPGRVAAGQTSGLVGVTMDLTATILAAAGVPAPHGLDGVNLLAAIQEGAPSLQRTLFWRIDRPERRQRAARQGPWKLVQDGGQDLLFDLPSDPGERQDLAARHPDIVTRLKQQLAAWEQDVDRTAVVR